MICKSLMHKDGLISNMVSHNHREIERGGEGCREAHVRGTLTIHLQHTHTHTHTHTHGLFQDSPPLSGMVFPFTNETCHSDSDYQSQTLFKEGLHEVTTCV